MKNIFQYCFLLILALSGCSSKESPDEQNEFSFLHDEEILIGIYGGDGADPYIQQIAKKMFEWMGYNVTGIFPEDLNSRIYKDIDLIYFPGGSTVPYRIFITDEGRENLRNFVSNGGAYIGTCAGALIACKKNLWLGDDDNEGLFGFFPGTGIAPIPEIDDGDGITFTKLNINTSSSIAQTHPDSMWLLYYNSPYFELDNNAEAEVIARYTIGNYPAFVSTTYGEGRVFLTGPHPEFEEDSDRDGNSYFDGFDDRGSDWNFMKSATEWCLKITN